MDVYTVALRKGGSAKTTTTAKLVVALTARRNNVLAIDLDEQGTLTARLGISPTTEVEAVAADMLSGDATAHKATIQAPSVDGAWVSPGTHHLTQLDQMPEITTSLRLPTQLKAPDESTRLEGLNPAPVKSSRAHERRRARDNQGESVHLALYIRRPLFNDARAA